MPDYVFLTALTRPGEDLQPQLSSAVKFFSSLLICVFLHIL